MANIASSVQHVAKRAKNLKNASSECVLPVKRTREWPLTHSLQGYLSSILLCWPCTKVQVPSFTHSNIMKENHKVAWFVVVIGNVIVRWSAYKKPRVSLCIVLKTPFVICRESQIFPSPRAFGVPATGDVIRISATSFFFRKLESVITW